MVLVPLAKVGMTAVADDWFIPDKMAEKTAAKKEGRTYWMKVTLESTLPPLLMGRRILIRKRVQTRPTKLPATRAAPGLKLISVLEEKAIAP